ncbi:CMT1A duplicated region transcript 4 protein homolog isoform X2 [Ornithorhynchus anatinus]|uniref:CMT1A duplicated region transcript 4 protein homolog isoform X2 n=1 Tax=Ornithorhynchus anatinus TaxID=9258 RepID=UPI0010A7C0DF|nr:CMT1A duplicated region transcript 4 protein homolog isoform X2 [Ornithorhynchus anatinus]
MTRMVRCSGGNQSLLLYSRWNGPGRQSLLSDQVTGSSWDPNSLSVNLGLPAHLIHRHKSQPAYTTYVSPMVRRFLQRSPPEPELPKTGGPPEMAQERQEAESEGPPQSALSPQNSAAVPRGLEPDPELFPSVTFSLRPAQEVISLRVAPKDSPAKIRYGNNSGILLAAVFL